MQSAFEFFFFFKLSLRRGPAAHTHATRMCWARGRGTVRIVCSWRVSVSLRVGVLYACASSVCAIHVGVASMRAAAAGGASSGPLVSLARVDLVAGSVRGAAACGAADAAGGRPDASAEAVGELPAVVRRLVFGGPRASEGGGGGAPALLPGLVVVVPKILAEVRLHALDGRACPRVTYRNGELCALRISNFSQLVRKRPQYARSCQCWWEDLSNNGRDALISR